MAAQRVYVIMPQCKGLPSGPCPQDRNDKTVVIGKGDSLLCQSCDTEHHRLFDESKKLNKARPNATKQAVSVADDTNTKSKSTRSASARTASAASSVEQLGDTNGTALPAVAESHTITPATLTSSAAASKLPATDVSAGASSRTGIKIIINELLAYATFYRDKCTGADLHKMIVSFYLPSEINESKTLLLK